LAILGEFVSAFSIYICCHLLVSSFIIFVGFFGDGVYFPLGLLGLSSIRSARQLFASRAGNVGFHFSLAYVVLASPQFAHHLR
jgi:hypothetical protein